MNSLRKHYLATIALMAANAESADPRYSKQGRPTGTTLTRQNDPIIDAETIQNPDHHNPLELKFFNDFEQISNVQSQSKRNELKAELLPEYQSYINDCLAAGVSDQNDMLLKLMVWAMDAHDFETGTRIAEFALLNKMVMPAPFARDVANFYAEQLAEELKKIDDITPYLDLLERAVDFTASFDMQDQVRAKLYRAYGYSLKATQPTQAINAFEKALKLDPNVGVKTELAQLKKTVEQT